MPVIAMQRGYNTAKEGNSKPLLTQLMGTDTSIPAWMADSLMSCNFLTVSFPMCSNLLMWSSTFGISTFPAVRVRLVATWHTNGSTSLQIRQIEFHHFQIHFSFPQSYAPVCSSYTSLQKPKPTSGKTVTQTQNTQGRHLVGRVQCQWQDADGTHRLRSERCGAGARQW